MRLTDANLKNLKLSIILIIMLYVEINNNKMDSFELNKIIAAVLMVALLIIGLGKIADVAFQVKKPENPGYRVEVESQLTSGTSQAAEVVEKIDIAAFMTLGDAVSGKKILKNVQPAIQ